MAAQDPIVLVGAGDTGGAVCELLAEHPSFRVAGFLDDSRTGSFLGLPVLGPLSLLPHLKAEGIGALAISISMDTALRVSIASEAQRSGLRLPVLSHRTASVSPHAEVGAGTILFPFASIGYGATVGACCILKDYASVFYQAQVGDFCLLGPYAFVGTHAQVGAHSLLLTRSSIANRCIVGERCVVYPHTYVNHPADAGSHLVGSPSTEARHYD